MFTGQAINETEGRAVLHTALRNFSGEPVYVAGSNVMPGIQEVQERMEAFCGKVHRGEWTGYTGKRIRYVVNIGIGGSDLGPVMVTEAMKPYVQQGLEPFLVSNVAGKHIEEQLIKIELEEKIFLIATKT